MSSEAAVPQDAPRSGASVWLSATRPRTLWAAVAPVWVGAAVAASFGPVNLPAVLVAAACACLLQIGTNLANDYFDYKNGADTDERIGPVRVTQAGLLSPGTVARAAAYAFGMAVLGGLYLVYLGGWPVLAIGLLSILAGVLYTGGPLPLGYNGLGDLCVFIFFGLVAVGGTTYVATGAWYAAAFQMGIPLGALATAILVVNNQRDRHTDRQSGKRTLAVILGSGWMKAEYAALIALAYGLPTAGVLTGVYPSTVLITLFSVPEAVRLAVRFHKTDGPALNPLLGQTARLLALYAALLGAGWLL